MASSLRKGGAGGGVVKISAGILGLSRPIVPMASRVLLLVLFARPVGISNQERTGR
jgi:hypothetical protein